MGGATSLLDVINTYEEVAQANLDLQFDTARLGDIQDSKADISKLKGIGFVPRWSLADGLQQYWKFNQQQQNDRSVLVNG